MMDDIGLWIILDYGLSWMVDGIGLWIILDDGWYWIMDDNNMAGG